MLFSLGMVLVMTLAVGLVMFFAPGGFLLTALGLQCPELFAGVFPGELSGLDGLGDLSHGIGRDGAGRDLTVSPGLALVRLFALGGFFLTTLGHQGFHFLTGFFPGELSGLDGLDNLSPGFSELVAAAFFFTLCLSLVTTLALGSLLLNVGFDVFPFFAGFFPGDLAALDGFGEFFPGICDELVAAAFFFTLGVFLLAVLSLHRPELFAGIFPRELACLDGLDDFLPGSGGLVASAFGFSFAFTLGLSLVTTLAPGRFPGLLLLQAFFVTIDRFFESRIGVFLGDLAFLDKLVKILTHLSEFQAPASGVTAVLVLGFWFAILGHRCHGNGEDNCCHNS